MKIIVFGATGRVGSCLVEQALEAGHQVTAFVRDVRRLKVDSDKIAVIEGDVLDAAAVRSVLESGFDAVVVAIGAGVLKPSTIVTDGTKAIISGMKACGIERLLGVSGTAEMAEQTPFGKLNTALLKRTPVGHAVRDHDGALQELHASGLRWVMAGCPYIKGGARRYQYRTSLVFPGGFKIIHPPDVADFLVKELAENRFDQQVVGVWY